MADLHLPFDKIAASAFESDPSTIFCLDSDLRLIYCNSAWDRFAMENGGDSLRRPAPLGHSVLESVAPPLRDYYRSGYERVLREATPWQHLYECSSAGLFRRFFMEVLPLRQTRGLLVVNSLRVEHPHEFPSNPPSEAAYRTAGGSIVMCCHCRRTRRNQPDSPSWDWVADYVARMPYGVSHGLCGPCLEYHYSR